MTGRIREDLKAWKQERTATGKIGGGGSCAARLDRKHAEFACGADALRADDSAVPLQWILVATVVDIALLALGGMIFLPKEKAIRKASATVRSGIHPNYW